MSRRLGAVAVVVVVAVAAASAFTHSRSGHGSQRRSSPVRPTTTVTAGTTPATPTLDAVVAKVETFVAGQRGLAFKREVPVQLLGDAPFAERLRQDAGEDAADVAVEGRLLKALRLIDPGVDLPAVLQRFIGDAVVGFYDPKRHELVVRAGSLTPYARATLAHELTHALDDQWFDLDRPELDAPGHGEEALAFSALAEGDAVRVGDAYRAALPSAERQQANQEEEAIAGKIDLRGVPPVVPALISFPYVSGPGFVAALVASGGQRRVDSAFRVPPTTSEDILDPQAWLAGRAPGDVPAPRADGPEVDHGVYGRSTLELTLAPVVGAGTARRAAEGWRGDRYVAWDAGSGRTCVRATFAMAGGSDLRELTQALQRWARDGRATVEAGAATVGFTACR